MRVSLICAVDDNNGIGIDNQLLCHLPQDLKYFKKQTLGKPIIMGRKTFESIGRPLPKRKNIVLTRQDLSKVDGVYSASHLDEALALAGDVEEVMVIGGANIYQQTLPLATRLYITEISYQFKADVFFPTFDKTQFVKVFEEAHFKDEKNPYDFRFVIYEKENMTNV